MYLHQTIIYRVTDNLYGIDITQNNLDKTDYETNHKASVTEVSDITIAETTIRQDVTYAVFEGLMNGITWADVLAMTTNNKYVLSILSDNDI